MSKTLRTVTAFALMSLIPSPQVFASCLNIPDEAIASIDDLIDRSPRIALVTLKAPAGSGPSTESPPTLDRDAAMRKATEARTSDRMVVAMGTVSLSVIENLKGDGENRISRTNVWPHKSQHDFDRHRDPGFWDDEHAGLVAFDAACRPETAYATGKTYLLFEGPPHVKMSELIVSDDDAWLAYVRERLAK